MVTSLISEFCFFSMGEARAPTAATKAMKVEVENRILLK
jgi:hypothetical protein